MDYFWVIGCFVIFFVMLFANYGSFAKVVVAWSRPPVHVRGSSKVKASELTTKEKILCYIPLVQVCMVKKAVYNNYTVEKILSIISAVGILVNLINKFFLPINSLVMFICNIIMILCTLLFMIIYGEVTARCAKAYDYSWLLIIACALVPYLACSRLTGNIPYKMKQLYKEETLSGYGGDTIIKQRTN